MYICRKDSNFRSLSSSLDGFDVHISGNIEPIGQYMRAIEIWHFTVHFESKLNQFGSLSWVNSYFSLKMEQNNEKIRHIEGALSKSTANGSLDFVQEMSMSTGTSIA